MRKKEIKKECRVLSSSVTKFKYNILRAKVQIYQKQYFMIIFLEMI